MKKHLPLIIAFFILFSFVMILTSCNDTSTIACSACGEENPDTVKFCSNCGKSLTDVNENNNNDAPNNNVGGHIHAFGNWETITNATCTQKGEKQRSCSCGDVQKQDIPALGHTEVIDQAVSASCTTAGLTQGKHCSVCNTVIIAQQTVPAGHIEVIDQAVAATCTTNGLTQGKHCSACNTVIVAQQTIQASHTEVIDQAVAATCTKEGKTQGKHCSKCGTVIQAQVATDKIEHNYSNGKCTMCSADQPLQTKYFTFGDTVSFHYEYGSSNGDFTVSLGSSYTKVTYTANKYSWVYGQQFIRIPIQITNDSDSTDALTLSLIKLYDSNNSSNNPENSLYSNQIISKTMFIC